MHSLSGISILNRSADLDNAWQRAHTFRETQIFRDSIVLPKNKQVRAAFLTSSLTFGCVYQKCPAVGRGERGVIANRDEPASNTLAGAP